MEGQELEDEVEAYLAEYDKGTRYGVKKAFHSIAISWGRFVGRLFNSSNLSNLSDLSDLSNLSNLSN